MCDHKEVMGHIFGITHVEIDQVLKSGTQVLDLSQDTLFEDIGTPFNDLNQGTHVVPIHQGIPFNVRRGDVALLGDVVQALTRD
jgi:hypothetical protein